ncbi:uncharacterized protein LOC122276824 [Carya illinoinensis]|uniref:uncharacterized protein LOC122276824 n=1 Tax=Carya illinoinensis TaxID=32201 RepID=UPI001C71C1D5|nr:uncharacterized protein LOC122276824 [Carya illinoinensis]
MKLLSWNVHGLGNPRGIRTLCDLIKKEALDIVFLQETRLQVCDFDSCKFKLGFSNCLVVSIEGRSGGIALLWGRDINLTILNYSKYHIDACVTVDGISTDKFFLTGVYGHPNHSLRHRTWDLICSLCRQVDEAWLVFGDFNEILYQHEKWGGRDRLERQMLAFRQVVNDCSLRDIGFRGPKYTWCNGRESCSSISVRLDRLFGNPQWWARFAHARVLHEGAAYSDHSPIWLLSEVATVERRRVKLFGFEAMWLGETGCDNIVEDTWRGATYSNSMDDLMRKISNCGKILQAWNHTSFGHVQKKLTQAKLRLRQLQEMDLMSLRRVEQQAIREDIQKWKKNSIGKLLNDEGEWQEGELRDGLITEYFQQMFTTANQRGPMDFLVALAGRVSNAMNEDFSKRYTEAEV